MNYRTLGHSALQISTLGFGCMSLDDEANATRTIHRAIAFGVNFFDTADLYDKGLNEKIVGRILKEKRGEVILATKVGNQLRPDGSGWDWNPRKEYIIGAVEKSLRRLQTGHIDLYQLHGGTIDDPIDETIEAFELLQQQGKIRYYGISSIRPNVIREYVRRSNIVSVMMQYSLLDRRPEESCLQLLQEHGIGVLARGVLARGLLVDKSPAPFLNYTADQVAKIAAAVREHSNNERNPSQTALQFVLLHPAITSAVAGIRTAEQLEMLAGTTNGTTDVIPPLTQQEKDILSAINPVNHYDQHR